MSATAQIALLAALFPSSAIILFPSLDCCRADSCKCNTIELNTAIMEL